MELRFVLFMQICQKIERTYRQ